VYWRRGRQAWFGYAPSLDADLKKVARNNPEIFAKEPGVLVARAETLKQTLGWDDRQCGEAIAKYPDIISVRYENQYVLYLVQYARCRDRPRPVGMNPRHGAALKSA
jgi:hypothetical protein